MRCGTTSAARCRRPRTGPRSSGARSSRQREAARPALLPERRVTVPNEPDKSDGTDSAESEDERRKRRQAESKHKIALPEGAMVVDRVGRVIPGEPWWSLVFEDQGTHPKDKPMPLLPNQLLETAIALTSGGTEGVVLVVSGEATLHNEDNYLLLRKVLIRRDLGNIR